MIRARNWYFSFNGSCHFSCCCSHTDKVEEKLILHLPSIASTPPKTDEICCGRLINSFPVNMQRSTCLFPSHLSHYFSGFSVHPKSSLKWLLLVVFCWYLLPNEWCFRTTKLFNARPHTQTYVWNASRSGAEHSQWICDCVFLSFVRIYFLFYSFIRLLLYEQFFNDFPFFFLAGTAAAHATYRSAHFASMLLARDHIWTIHTQTHSNGDCGTFHVYNILYSKRFCLSSTKITFVFFFFFSSPWLARIYFLVSEILDILFAVSIGIHVLLALLLIRAVVSSATAIETLLLLLFVWQRSRSEMIQQ